MQRYNYHDSALKLLATETASLERLKGSPTHEGDMSIVDGSVKFTPPIELNNDEKERFRYGTPSSILMCWALRTTGEPKERDRLIVSGGKNYRIRKVKAWPTINPAFYELHIEDEE